MTFPLLNEIARLYRRAKVVNAIGVNNAAIYWTIIEQIVREKIKPQ